MTDEEFNQRFAIQQGAARFWVLTVIVILFLSALIWWVSLAQADETCPVANQEARITEAIVDGQDHVWVFRGPSADSFMEMIENLGLLGGIKSKPDPIYVIEYKTIYHVFFIEKACIIGAYDFKHSLLEGILP